MTSCYFINALAGDISCPIIAHIRQQADKVVIETVLRRLQLVHHALHRAREIVAAFRVQVVERTEHACLS